MNYIIWFSDLLIYLIGYVVMLTNKLLSNTVVLPQIVIDYVGVCNLFIVISLISYIFLNLLNKLFYNMDKLLSYTFYTKIIKDDYNSKSLKKINKVYIIVLSYSVAQYNKFRYMANKIIGIGYKINDDENIIYSLFNRKNSMMAIIDWFIKIVLLNYKINITFVIYEYFKNDFIRNNIDYIAKNLVERTNLNLLVLTTAILIICYKSTNRGILSDLNSSVYKKHTSESIEFYRNNLENISKIIYYESKILYNLLRGIDHIVKDIQREIIKSLNLSFKSENSICEKLNISRENKYISVWYSNIGDIQALDNFCNNVKAAKEDNTYKYLMLLNRYDYRFRLMPTLFLYTKPLSYIITKNTIIEFINNRTKEIGYYIPARDEGLISEIIEEKIIKDIGSEKIKRCILSKSVDAIKELIILNEILNVTEQKLRLNNHWGKLSNYENALNKIKL